MNTVLQFLMEIQSRIGTKEPFGTAWHEHGGAQCAVDTWYAVATAIGSRTPDDLGKTRIQVFDDFSPSQQAVILEKAIYKAQQDLL